MASTRSAKMVAMANKSKDAEIMYSLKVPIYESTKGTNAYERELYFNNICNQYQENEHFPSPGLRSPSASLGLPLQEEKITSSCEKKRLTRRVTIESARRYINLSETTNNKILEENITSSINSDEEDPFADTEDEYVPSLSPESSSEALTDIDENEADMFEKKLNKKKTSAKPKIKKIMDNMETDKTDKPDENKQTHKAKKQDATRETDKVKKQDANKETDKAENPDENIDSDIEEITFSFVTKTKEGKRLRDKRHCCYICNKLLTNNMARHFELVHGNDIQVAKILALPKKSKSRRDEFETLIKAGDFYYNCNILAIKEGELILVRRPEDNKRFSYNDFAPCSYCLGFMAKHYLWHHLRQCKMKVRKTEDKENKRGPLNESAALLFEILGPKIQESFRNDIINSFRNDNISEACKEDLLIIKIGSFLYEKYGASQSELIRQSMRQLGRLKRELKNKEEKKSLGEWISPKYFDDIIDATKTICGNEPDNIDTVNNFKIPSLALKIGHLLRKCVALESGTALRKGLILRHNELKAFTELMDLEWAVRISSKAYTTLQRRKMNATQLLPITSDLMKLNLHLKDKLKELKPEIEKKCTVQTWKNLASVTLSRIILFNKRRSGEAAKMTITDYQNRPLWSEQGTVEFKNSLTPLEKELANKLTVIEIIGKRGKIVPVILSKAMKTSIELLIKYRKQAGVNEKNIYIFARGKNSKGHLRGHDCLRTECNNAFLLYAENITSTKLRKYIATVCQIFNLTENETDWLARHLGHDIRVHREFYRMHESAVELTKVSRLLLAVDNGEAEKYSGKKLEDIKLDDLPPLEEEDEEEEEEVDDELPEETKEEKSSNRKKSVMKKNNSKNQSRVPWTSEEIEILVKYFRSFIKRETLPGKKDCDECMEKHTTLKKRKWSDIKFAVKNQITRNKRCIKISK